MIERAVHRREARLLRHATGFAMANAGHDTRTLQARWLNLADTLLARGGTPSCNCAARLHRGKAQIIHETGL